MRIDTKITRKLGLGPHPSDGIVEDLEAWIEEQLNSDPIRLSIARVLDSSPSVVEWPKRLNLTLEDRVERLVSFRRQSDELDNLKLPANERDTRFDKLKSKYWAGYIDQHKFAHAQVYSKDHVNLRLATFWLNHFTVAESNLVVAELIQNYFEEAIFANLDNSFSDMLFDAISHPAMLTYLDNIYSIGENSITAKDCRARPDCFKGLNDNLGRELLELHTVSPARRYTEADIKSAAEILAGWGYIFDKPPPRNAGLRQLYIEKHAEPGRKTVLGKTFGPGKAALRKLTDYLAEDPATIRHLAGKLALHFIGDEYARENTDAIEAAWTRSKGSAERYTRDRPARSGQVAAQEVSDSQPLAIPDLKNVGCAPPLPGTRKWRATPWTTWNGGPGTYIPKSGMISGRGASPTVFPIARWTGSRANIWTAASGSPT